MSQPGKSSRWHKATWPTRSKKRSQGTTSSARHPGSEVNAPGTSEAREICWGSTPARVSNTANEELTKELTLKEIKEAIAAMPKDKAPRCDGIPTEFFKS
ncbi:unnamed protein product [Sphagnum balticum]